MYPKQTCLYAVCICMYLFAHIYKISQLLCCLYVLQDTYNYKHAGSLMLKYNQIVAVYDAAVTALQQGPTFLSSNLLVLADGGQPEHKK